MWTEVTWNVIEWLPCRIQSSFIHCLVKSWLNVLKTLFEFSLSLIVFHYVQYDILSLYINGFYVVGLKLYEPCISHEECNGTEFAGNCTKIENSTICFCQDGYLDFKGKCFKGIFPWRKLLWSKWNQIQWIHYLYCKIFNLIVVASSLWY